MGSEQVKGVFLHSPGTVLYYRPAHSAKRSWSMLIIK